MRVFVSDASRFRHIVPCCVLCLGSLVVLLIILDVRVVCQGEILLPPCNNADPIVGTAFMTKTIVAML